jgi:hypothetical protein
MRERSRWLIGMIVAVAALSGPSQAQYGYGYYPYGYGRFGWGGWGGWGGTAQGDIARGLGYFNMGAGIYNHQTAIAAAINTDTLMRWNQYVYLSQKEATREYYALRDARIAKDKDSYNTLMKRIQDNPNSSDITNGDALNAALDQLSDPRIHSSVLRSADAPVSGKMIQDIPFRNAAEAVTFSLSQLRKSTEWPAVLMDSRFKEERDDFEILVDEARKDSLDDGQVSPTTLKKMRALVGRLRDKLASMPLDDKAENQEAHNFVKTITALTRMLEKPDIEKVLAELKKIDNTTVGHLLAFMQTFNLRFAPATTPEQRRAYTDLYAKLDQTRDKILSEAKLNETNGAAPGKGNIHDFFSAMDLDHISGNKKAPAPPPPPQQP